MFVGTDFLHADANRPGHFISDRHDDGSYVHTQNGSVSGVMADNRLYSGASGQVSFDPGITRPYVDRNGKLAVTVNSGRYTYEKGERVAVKEHRLVWDLVNQGIMLPPPVTNATALRKEEWIELDRTVVRAARKRLRFYSDVNKLAGAFSVPGMAKTMLEYETMADPGEAVQDMTGLTPGRSDETQFQLEGFPLTLTHSDFWLDSRRLAISRNSGTPIDGTLGEASARRVGEMIEKVGIGTNTGMTYGGQSTQTGGYGRTSKQYGITNFSNRLTFTGYKPTGNGRAGTGWTPQDTIFDVLAAITALRLQNFYGPWMIYHSTDWDDYLDRDYFVTTGVGSINGLATKTLRQRLCDIGEGDGTDEGDKVILGVRRLDFMFHTAPTTTIGNAGMIYFDNTFPFTMVMVQMTPEVVRAINGLDVTTVQWEEKGGMQLMFKVMCIQGTMIRADYYGNCGINHISFTT